MAENYHSDALNAADLRLREKRDKLGIGIAPMRPVTPRARDRSDKSPARSVAPDDSEENMTDAYAPPIAEGEYVVGFLREERGQAYGRGVLFVRFQVAEGQHAGRELLRFYNTPRGARLARSSSLWRDFVAVTGRRPPTKGFKPSWAFSNCLLRARVVTVHQRPEGRERISMADCERYSKIDALLGLLQGAPPALSGSGGAR
jgi:hypothetical protein